MSPVYVFVHYFKGFCVYMLVYNVCLAKVSSQLRQQLSKPLFLCFRGEQEALQSTATHISECF